MIDGMLAIDAHTHVYPLGRKLYGKFSINTSPEMLIEEMHRNGFDMAVIVNSGSVVPELNRENNDYVKKVVETWPEKFIGFASVCPMVGSAAVEEMERAIKVLGLKGIKLYPPQGYPIDSPIVFPVIEKAIDLDVPVVVHSDFANQFCTPYQVARLASIYPNATIIMAHLGMQYGMCFMVPEIVKDCENIVLDTSAAPDSPDATFFYPIRELGIDRVIFGSDALYFDQAVALKKLEQAEKRWGLTREEKEHILSRNIARILKLRI